MDNREQLLGNEKISKLLMKLSIPATLAMLVNALYNITDTIFVGQKVGYLAIGGLAICFPMQTIMMAFSGMIGVGSSSIISRRLGAGKKEEAFEAAGNAFTLAFTIGTTICIIGQIFMPQLLTLFGATDELMPYATSYLRFILIGFIYSPMVMSSNNMIRSEGNAKIAMNSMLIGAIMNIVLDYIFVIVIGTGIAGAAIATIISQFSSFIFVMIYFRSGKSIFKLKLHHLKVDWGIARETVKVGASTFVRQGGSSVMAILLNHSLVFYGGNMAVSVYGIINKILMLMYMPAFGISQGMQPIAGFNYGAKKFDRVKAVVKLGIKYAILYAITFVVLIEVFPDSTFRLFSGDQTVIDNGIFAIRLMICMTPFAVLQTLSASLFQTLGKAMPALLLTLSRQILLFIPLMLLLPTLGLGLLGIWLAFPAADALSALVTAYFFRKEMKDLDRLEKEQAVLKEEAVANVTCEDLEYIPLVGD